MPQKYGTFEISTFSVSEATTCKLISVIEYEVMYHSLHIWAEKNALITEIIDLI